MCACLHFFGFYSSSPSFFLLLPTRGRLCGFEPFAEDDDEKMFERILACDLQFVSPYWDSISQNAKVGHSATTCDYVSLSPFFTSRRVCRLNVF